MVRSIKRFLFRRATAMAYKALFAPGGNSDIVLADLREFCNAKPSQTTFCFDANGRYDPQQMAALEGRREVFNRIVSWVGLSEVELDERHVEPYEDE